jgi:hypothetical protein
VGPGECWFSALTVLARWIYVGGRARRGPGMRHPEGDLPFLLPPSAHPLLLPTS